MNREHPMASKGSNKPPHPLQTPQDKAYAVNQRVALLFKIWSKFYDHPWPQKLFYGKVHQVLLNKTLELQPDQILDAGCGTGELMTKMARRWPAVNLTGLDLSHQMLAVARDKSFACPSTHLLEGTVYQIPAATQQFDLITNTISSHFYMQFDQALNEFYRVLKPGGTLAMASMGNGLLRFIPGPWQEALTIPDASYRSPAKQRAEMEAAGFMVESISPLPFMSWLYIAKKPKLNA